MKKKVTTMLLTISLLSMTACGKQETTAATTEPIVESTQVETTVTEETVTTETEVTTEETEPTDSLADEVTDNIVYPDVNPEEVDPKTTTMDAETAAALGQAEGKEIDAQYGSEMAWAEYAKSQGADNVLCWCWIYYTGQGAGDQESYAVYMKEDSPRYGEVFHLGDYLPDGSFFIGANNKEHGIADNRELMRKANNGEIEGGTITQDEDGKIHIVVN